MGNDGTLAALFLQVLAVLLPSLRHNTHILERMPKDYSLSPFTSDFSAQASGSLAFAGLTLSDYVPVESITLHYTYISLCIPLLVSSLWND